MKLFFSISNLHPRRTFRISRAAKTEVRNVIVRVEHEGITGLGEASPNPFYHETAEGVVEKLSGIQDRLQSLNITSPADIAQFWQDVWPRVAPSRAAQCGMDLALWEWLARVRNVSVCELATGEKPQPVQSFGTLGIMDEKELREAIQEFRGFRRIKVKSGADADLSAVHAVREVSDSLLVVDANASWGRQDVPALARRCRDLGVAFLEQPLAPQDDNRMPEILKNSAVPIMADESCVEESDVERMAGAFSGFNIKLVKCGGLTPALRMLKRGRELGMTVMVGCMLETSVLISAGAVVAQKTDYADLDGAWLLRDDPFSGLPFQDGAITPPPGPGWGIRPVN